MSLLYSNEILHRLFYVATDFCIGCFMCNGFLHKAKKHGRVNPTKGIPTIRRLLPDRWLTRPLETLARASFQPVGLTRLSLPARTVGGLCVL